MIMGSDTSKLLSGYSLAGQGAVLSAPSPLEEEVVFLFEQFRAPVLRYVLSFRVPVYDAEELVQDVFLALFEHLRRGKSRANLQGWVFRVA